MKIHILLLSCLCLVLVGCKQKILTQTTNTPPSAPTLTSSATPEPTPTPFRTYTAPEVKLQEVYEVAVLGDSMTEALGPHGGPMTEKLNQLYDQYNKDILVDNYAVGSTNITSLDERLKQKTQAREWTFEPLLIRQEIDLIIVESFAYNPLSHIDDRQAAIQEQNRYLTDLMTKISNELSNTRVVFVSTIAPNRLLYAQNTSNLSDEESTLQANERIEYLENHIQFALTHNIPLINLYQISLSENGDGQAQYINPNDWIHPSFAGIDLISNTIAEAIYQQRLLPY